MHATYARRCASSSAASRAASISASRSVVVPRSPDAVGTTAAGAPAAGTIAAGDDACGAHAASATTTTGNSSPLASWIVISRTASASSEAITPSTLSWLSSAPDSIARTKPGMSAPRTSSKDWATRRSFSTFAIRSSPSGATSMARS